MPKQVGSTAKKFRRDRKKRSKARSFGSGAKLSSKEARDFRKATQGFLKSIKKGKSAGPPGMGRTRSN